jgi:CheY-like chemotaxis protein
MTATRAALVIDDDPDIASLLRVLLETRGFEVDTLADGIEALDLPRVYDVILLDLKMPVFDGERLTDYWELTKPDILRRVIVLSGYSGWTRGRQLSTFATVKKPIDLDNLLSVVDACAGQQ